jgi:peptidoglycan/xylan/chitin deacetylase (PgdA/CDA1 family)
MLPRGTAYLGLTHPQQAVTPVRLRVVVGTWRGGTRGLRISSSVKARGRGALGRLGSPLGKLLFRRSLTVVCYHRVVDQVEPGQFPEVVSATPAMFEQHLEMMGQDHRFVSLEDVVGWLGGGVPLPSQALLLTFDDGYRDNYDNAYPILRRRGIPATFFVATGHMDSGELLWWDLATALISEAAGATVDLPLLGPVTLSGPDGRTALARRWVSEAKLLPNTARLEALDSLAHSLLVTPRPRPPVAMSWDQAREMIGAGMAFGGHTRSHPILARMAPDEARKDIADGLDRIREELGRAAVAFAYPNGGIADFDSTHQRALADLGVVLAFTLVSGPALLGEIERDPYEVRRVYVGQGDDPERLRLKLLGLGRLPRRAARDADGGGGQEQS